MTVKLFKIQLLSILIIAFTPIISSAEKLYWPPPPDEPRIEYVGEIDCKNLQAGSGFFSKLKNFISGKDEKNILKLPFDVTIAKNKMYLTFQGYPYLIEVNLSNNSFKKYHDKNNPFIFPVCLSTGHDNIIYITDSENKTVYKFKDGKVKPFITEGLSRPTGITVNVKDKLIYIIDTGTHNLKIFNFEGKLINTVSDELAPEDKFHFPTFISMTNTNNILVNDGLNYKIKKFDSNGNFVSSFGEEGDGPGTFSRPKGVATDSEGNIYVVDNLFDNLQVFDSTGQFLLVVGSIGDQPGQFYSPSGLAINNDTIYIADTYNDRIQILHFLGGPSED